MKRMRDRLERQEGFTLIELLVVIVIIAILAAIAVPAYLGFTTQAQGSAAQADLRSAVPAAEAYFTTNQTYVGLTTATMKTFDAGLSSAVQLSGSGPTLTAYCLVATVSGQTWYYSGPGGVPVNAANKPANC